MDTDLTPIDELEDESFDETPTPLQSVAEDGKLITIVARGLSKYFTLKGNEIKAVDDVSFTFTERQFIAIMGTERFGEIDAAVSARWDGSGHKRRTADRWCGCETPL